MFVHALDKNFIAIEPIILFACMYSPGCQGTLYIHVANLNSYPNLHTDNEELRSIAGQCEPHT